MGAVQAARCLRLMSVEPIAMYGQLWIVLTQGAGLICIDSLRLSRRADVGISASVYASIWQGERHDFEPNL